MDKITTPPEIKEILKGMFLLPPNPNKYIFIRDKNGYKKQEHRVILEENFGKIPKDAVIHHIDNNPKNNKIENLILFPSGPAHMNFHKKLNLLIKKQQIDYTIKI